MTLSEFRKWVLPPMAVLLLVLTVLAFSPFFKASHDMGRFCRELAPGLPLEEIQARAVAAGYETSAQTEGGGALVEDPRSFGRLQCALRLDDRGRLVSALRAD